MSIEQSGPSHESSPEHRDSSQSSQLETLRQEPPIGVEPGHLVQLREDIRSIRGLAIQLIFETADQQSSAQTKACTETIVELCGYWLEPGNKVLSQTQLEGTQTFDFDPADPKWTEAGRRAQSISALVNSQFYGGNNSEYFRATGYDAEHACDVCVGYGSSSKEAIDCLRRACQQQFYAESLQWVAGTQEKEDDTSQDGVSAFEGDTDRNGLLSLDNLDDSGATTIEDKNTDEEGTEAVGEASDPTDSRTFALPATPSRFTNLVD